MTSPFASSRAFTALLFGFACACPMVLVGGVNLRLSDVACLASAVALGIALVMRPSLHISAAVLALVLLFSFGWVVAETYYPSFLDSDPASAMILVRWLIAFPAAYWLCVLTSAPALRRAVLLGLILGWLVDTALLGYDFFAFGTLGHPAFNTAASHVFWVSGEYRAIGLFGHPNGAAIASLYVVPFLIGYADEYGGGALAGVLGWIATGLVFYFTRSRGATMAAAGLLGWWMVVNRPRQALLAAFLLLLALLLSSAVWPQLTDLTSGEGEVGKLLSRFTDSGAIRENSEGRLETILGALQLAFSHPLGMGSSYPPALEALTGFAATHNALLQLAVLGGPPLALLCTGMLLAGARHALGRSARTEDRVAFYLLFVSMFEAHFFNPMTSIILLWILGQVGQRSRYLQFAIQNARRLRAASSASAPGLDSIVR